MSMEYVRKKYGVPVKRGMRVKLLLWTDGKPGMSGRSPTYGRITSAENWVRVRVDGEKRTRRFHAHDLEYLDDDGEIIACQLLLYGKPHE